MLEIKIGEFIQKHIQSIVEYCKNDNLELNNLQDVTYSKDNLGLSSYSFIVLSDDKVSNERYWKKEYYINNENYRFCSQFGGSNIDNSGKTRSQREGEIFLSYLIKKELLLDEYKNKDIEFIVGKNNHNIETQSNPIQIEKKKSINTKNIILYGAPGVGKTHNYKKLVSLIEGGDFKEKDIFDFIIDNKYDDIEDGTIEKLYKNIENEKRIEFITFHQSYSYEDFIEGFRPQENGNIELEKGIFRNICKDAEENQKKNFYIVIDEINRGNISKIFGELITLIEESKRDNYKVTLPYSKDKFKVPSNLYIIATMNSTDKSIATIDIALRRRFTFLKMKPNSNLVKNSEAREFMNKLNIYIEKELGEDYMLGHSYFMGEDIDLGFIKEYKIKPLLEEYFYSDNKSADDIIEEALKG